MKETQEILIKMGFENFHLNNWKSEWFGVFILIKDATPEQLGKFIYDRGIRNGKTLEKAKECTIENCIVCEKKQFEEKDFTQSQIETLQSEVHKITGDGEVMGCFNELLGIKAS